MLFSCYISVIYLLSICYISPIYLIYICFEYLLYIISFTSLTLNARYFSSPYHIMRRKFYCDFANVFVTVSAEYIVSLYTHTMLCVCVSLSPSNCCYLFSTCFAFFAFHSFRLPSAFSHICPMILCAFDIYLHKCNV